ncbi:MAG: PAS domain-containing methyl-accepting chemotaxis protein [Actinobacteria bacterium]|nr:PAS domain-containing methyl-accepting chemotaxis protein [Actinomycetota bacterium]MBI3686495.1 PAS domain-containing methyl-accepting chemotaxis protein [Actinomycetota bacterium]
MVRLRGMLGGGTAELVDLTALLRDRNHPLTAVVDSLNGNCFIADMSLTLVYLNRQASRTVEQLAPAVRSTFGVDLKDLLGGSIHRFHKDPGRIERILADPRALPRQATFEFGGVALRTMINAITDGAGRRLGYVVLWDDVTRQMADYRQFDQAMANLSTVSRTIVEATGLSAASADSVAAATEELRSSVGEIARSSAEASTQVQQTVTAAKDGMETLRALQRTSTEIGEFLGLITSVSDQTKLLALNATIEASRAGEAGRGFAVVADEVKSLAATTAASITDIESRIAAIQAAAGDSVTALERIGTLVEKISESQSVVAAAIEQQSAVTGEIAQSAAGIAAEVGRTSREANKISEAVTEVTTRTEQLRGADQ